MLGTLVLVKVSGVEVGIGRIQRLDVGISGPTTVVEYLDHNGVYHLCSSDSIAKVRVDA